MSIFFIYISSFLFTIPFPKRNRPKYLPLKIAILNLFTLICVTGCSFTKEPIQRTDFLLDTVVTISLYEHSSQKLLDECFDLCKNYESKFSKSIPTSDIAKINASNGAPTKVSDETIDLLNISLDYCKLSEGNFDITIGNVSSLWNFTDGSNLIPSKRDIEKAISSIDYTKIFIQGNEVTLLDPNLSLDLGGTAKGYIADRLKEFLLSKGVNSALINLGGNLLSIGEKPDGSPFSIGIQMPFETKNTTIDVIQIKDQSVVSSGIYERYFFVDDILYHHILNPKTGYPYENNLFGVSILCDSSVDGDCLSTICFTLGLQKGMKLIETLDNTEALFITKDYVLHPSSGWGN